MTTFYRYLHSSRRVRSQNQKLDADAILKALSKSLLDNYNISTAIEKVKWEGLTDLNEERVDGLEKMLQQIEEFRSAILNNYNIDTLCDDIKVALKLCCDKYRKLDPIKYNLTSEGISFGFTTFKEAIQNLDEWLQDGFPDNMASMLFGLTKAASLLNPELHQEVRQPYQHVLRKIFGSLFLINEQCELDSDTFLSSVRDLTGMLDSIQKGDRTDFITFLTTYPDVFKFRGGLKEWLSSVEGKRAALKLLMVTVSPQIRMGLESFFGPEQELDETTRCLQTLWIQLEKLHPTLRPKRVRFSGSASLNFDSALLLAEKLLKLEELEKTIRRANLNCDLTEVNQELLKEVLGELAVSSLQKLSQIVQVLVESGYLKQDDSGYGLTPKAITRIGQIALAESFSSFDLSRRDKLSQTEKRALPTFTEETRKYEYGDTLYLNLPGTLFSALTRSENKGVPVNLMPADFEVFTQESKTQTSTVVLIDMSSSMDDKFRHAKQVVVTLKQLVEWYFPGDSIKVVGFYSLARQIDNSELIRIAPLSALLYNVPDRIAIRDLRNMEKHGGSDFPGDFTNIQEGLRLSRAILSKDFRNEKHIFLITDGEPTACIKDSFVYLKYPPTSFIFQETLKEVMRCTRNNIGITTFMLSDNRELREFVKQIEMINSGKAFFSSPQDLNRVIVVDYLRKKAFRF